MIYITNGFNIVIKENREQFRSIIEKKSGIYLIKNNLNQKIYIGSSMNIYRRWLSHISALQRGNHCNVKLQNSWNLHGSACFDFYVLYFLRRDTNESKKDFRKRLREEELQCLIEYNPFKEKGYNLSRSTEGMRRYLDRELLQHGKSIMSEEQFDFLIEKLLDPYNSLIDISKELNINYGTVKDIYEGNTYTGLTREYSFPKRKKHNFKEDKLKDIENLIKQGVSYREICNILNISMSYLKQLAEQNHIGAGNKICPVYQYDLKGNYITKFDTTFEGAIATNIDSKTIRNCCKGISNIGGNFIWSYNYPLEKEMTLIEQALGRFINGNIHPIIQYDIDYKPIAIYLSAKEASEENEKEIKRACLTGNLVLSSYWKRAKEVSNNDLIYLINNI